jgi:hypothetical protein
MLKIIITKVKKLKIDNKYDKKYAFIHSFTVLQTSTTIEQFDLNLEHIYDVFNREFISKEVTESINYMNIQLHTKENELDFDYYKRDFIKNSDAERISFVQNIELEYVKKNSPFTNYYEEKVKDFTNKSIFVTKIKNEYYNPILFNIIKNKLYIMPLWAGLIFKTITQFYSLNITRLTNNPAEFWFHILKNKILDGKMMPS